MFDDDNELLKKGLRPINH